MQVLRPKYKSLGAPIPVVSIPGIDDSHISMLGPRGIAEGASEFETYSSSSSGTIKGLLENFSVRTLYDKLEDQSLHVSSQLARHQADLRGFYDRICQQTEGLKQMLQNLDVSALAKATEKAAKSDSKIESDALQQSSEDEQRADALTGGSSAREQELMVSIQNLLIKYETGWLPAGAHLAGTQPTLVQHPGIQPGVQSGVAFVASVHHQQALLTSAVETSVNQMSVAHIASRHTTGGGASAVISSDEAPPSQGVAQSVKWNTVAFGEIIKMMNAERIQLEEELRHEEENELKPLIDRQESERNDVMREMGEKIAEALSGNLSEDEMRSIIDGHNKKLEVIESQIEAQKLRQQQELFEKLQKRRMAREAALREKHEQLAIENDLQIAEPENKSNPIVVLETLRNSMYLVNIDENTEIARTEDKQAEDETREQRNHMGNNFADVLETLVNQGTLSVEDGEEVKQEATEKERQLEMEFQQKRTLEASLMRTKLNKRKAVQNKKLQEKQEFEKAQAVREGNDLMELETKHEKDREVLEATYVAEETQHLAEISKKLNEEHKETLRRTHRDLLNKVAQEKGIDKVVTQQMIDKLRKDNDIILDNLELKKKKDIEDTKAKLALRKARREEEVKRRALEEASQRILAEQSQLTIASTQAASDVIAIPTVVVDKESIEEQAIKREQERSLDDLKERQEGETHKVIEKLEKDARDEEDRTLRDFENYRDRALREAKNRQAAEFSARNDISAEESQKLLANHQQELEDLMERLDRDRSRQAGNLKQKLAERRKQKQEGLKRKQEAEMGKELLEQKKEIAEARTKAVKEAEKEAMLNAIRENESDASEYIIRKIVEQRHNQELKDLEDTFAEERRVQIDEALAKLDEKHQLEKDDLRTKHEVHLRKLEEEDLTREELQQKRAQLFNQQHIELSSLERRQAEEKKHIQRAALSDWELRFARAKLELKEQHYQEFADYISELSPDQAQEHRKAIEKAQAAARELAELREKLEEQRKDSEEKLKREMEEFEAEEKKRMEEEIVVFNKQLDIEFEEERKKNDKAILALNQRKEALLKEKKLKAKQEVEKLSKQGASKEDQEKLLREHSKDLAKIMNKMDADRMRMQSSLEDRLKKKREEKKKSKLKQLENIAEENKKEFSEQIEAEVEKVKSDETIMLKEIASVDTLVQSASTDLDLRQSTPQGTEMPPAYKMAAPLTDGELVALLMSSPLYHKLQDIKKLVESGGFKIRKGKDNDDGYLDIKDDTLFSSDDELLPVDLNLVSGKDFIVYKFGCFIADLLVVHCYHRPITILLADKIPANKHLTKNAYRNSFYYDANNRILYLRRERLGSVGEFILVMVHTLTHISIENLTDDYDPNFVKEFYRSLSVVCNDLFFARYRRSAALNSAMQAFPEDTLKLEETGKHVLESVFGDAHTQMDRQNVIDELLDTKLVRSPRNTSVAFNQEAMFHRLTRYTDFVVGSKLRGFLGDLEEKVRTARLQGTDTEIDKRIEELKPKSKDERPVSRYLQSRGNLISRDTSRQISRNMAMARSSAAMSLRPTTRGKNEPQDDLYQVFLETQIGEIEDRMDNLNLEFTTLSRQAVELTEQVKSLESEVASQTDSIRSVLPSSDEYSRLTHLLRDSNSQLIASRARLSQAIIAKAETNRRLQTFKNELDDRKQQLQQHQNRPAEERQHKSKRKLESAMGDKKSKPSRK